MEKEALNVVDLKILKLLDEDPALSVTKLASMLRTSVPAAEYKIKRLMSLGAIDKFCTVINLFNIGYRLFRVSFLFSGWRTVVSWCDGRLRSEYHRSQETSRGILSP